MFYVSVFESWVNLMLFWGYFFYNLEGKVLAGI